MANSSCEVIAFLTAAILFVHISTFPPSLLSISPAKKEQLGTDEKQLQKKKVKELKVLDAKISQNLCK